MFGIFYDIGLLARQMYYRAALRHLARDHEDYPFVVLREHAITDELNRRWGLT